MPGKFVVGNVVKRHIDKQGYKGWEDGSVHKTVLDIRSDGAIQVEINGRYWDGRFFDLISESGTEVAGRKDDSGKLDMTLLDDMPLALEALVKVMQWAVQDKKPKPYERGSWLGVHADRYRAAILRHMRDATDQARPGKSPFSARFQRDKETNLLHLAHVACSAMMALENTLREIDNQK